MSDDVHVFAVSTGGRHGYPFRAVCSCGWQSKTYQTEFACQMMGEAHLEGKL